MQNYVSLARKRNAAQENTDRCLQPNKRESIAPLMTTASSHLFPQHVPIAPRETWVERCWARAPSIHSRRHLLFIDWGSGFIHDSTREVAARTSKKPLIKEGCKRLLSFFDGLVVPYIPETQSTSSWPIFSCCFASLPGYLIANQTSIEGGSRDLEYSSSRPRQFAARARSVIVLYDCRIEEM